MVNTEEILKKRDKMKKWVSIGAVGVVGFLVAPVIFLTIKGIIGLAVAAAIGFTLVMLAPVFALKVANLKYRMIDAEKVSHIKGVTSAAAENPIETLTALLHAKKQAFMTFKTSVETAAAARDNFRTKVQKFAERYPHRAAEFQNQLERMVDLVERKKVALRDAQQSLENGDMKLEEMKAYWEMSKDAIEANRAAGMDTGDAYEKLKADTACDAVFESMNTAFAQLEVAAALELDTESKSTAQAPQLTHSDPVILNVPVRQTQKASR